VTVQQSEHLSPISNHYTQKQWWFNKVNIFLLSQIIIHKNSDGSTKWTSYSISNHYTQKQWRFKESEHLSPISNHYTQEQWWFNKVNIFLLSQIIIHKNSDGSTKWTSFSYLKSLYTKTVMVQQSEHPSPISNHYTQKQWWFNKVNIFLLSQIIIHKNSDGSTKWTSFSYLKSLYTRTVTVQQSEHLSPISNHYTQKQWPFNKVNIYILSHYAQNDQDINRWKSRSWHVFDKTIWWG
jgi:diacylglycerol kinase family enzyme